MRRSFVIFALIVLAIAMPSIVVAEVDTVQIGIDKAFMHPNGLVSIPLYLSNTSSISGIAWIVTISSTGQPVTPDSISAAGRCNTIPVVGAFTIGQSTPQQVDTTCLFWVMDSRHCISPGSGIVAEAWLSGAALGDQISIAASTANSTSGCAVDTVHVVDCDRMGPKVIPAVFMPTTLTVVPMPVEVTCSDTVAVWTEQRLDIPVSVTGYGSNVTLSVVSFTGPGGPVTPPAIVGAGPFHVQWTPSLKAGGTYTLILRGGDGYGLSVDKIVTIIATNSTVQGDTDCNGVVDASDLARIVAYLSGIGKPPVCPGK